MVGRATRVSIICRIYRAEDPLPCDGPCEGCQQKGVCRYFMPTSYYDYESMNGRNAPIGGM